MGEWMEHHAALSMCECRGFIKRVLDVLPEKGVPLDQASRDVNLDRCGKNVEVVEWTRSLPGRIARVRCEKSAPSLATLRERHHFLCKNIDTQLLKPKWFCNSCGDAGNP